MSEYEYTGPDTDTHAEPHGEEPHHGSANFGDAIGQPFGFGGHEGHEPEPEPHVIEAEFTDGSSVEVVDADHDGYAERLSYDGDGDGRVDSVFVDTDHDGVLDTEYAPYAVEDGRYPSTASTDSAATAESTDSAASTDSAESTDSTESAEAPTGRQTLSA